MASACPNLGYEDEKRSGVNFHQYRNIQFFRETYEAAYRDIPRVDGFLRRTLPTLACHYDRKALNDLEQAHPWLAAFKPGLTPDWEPARSAFLQQGPSTIDVLTKFTNLSRIENSLGVLISKDISVGKLLLRWWEEEQELKDHMPPVPSSTSNIDWETAGKLGLTRERLQSLLVDNEFRIEDDETVTIPLHHSTQSVFRLFFIWVYASSNARESIQYCSAMDERVLTTILRPEQSGKVFLDCINMFLDALAAERSTPFWMSYKRRVQSFVQQVGCARAHDDVAENIAELRLFYSTTLGYIAKLQNQYIEEKLKNKRLRHYITALEFRHLLEHLTPPYQPNSTLYNAHQAGPRWQNFWEEAMQKEADLHFNNAPPHGSQQQGGQMKNQSQNQTDHPLKGVVNKRNPGRLDRSKNPPTINKEYQKGQLFRTGDDLYGVLSDEIHSFPAKEFMVEDGDGWTTFVTDILLALKPDPGNVDEATGEVDWDKERKRYL